MQSLTIFRQGIPVTFQSSLSDTEAAAVISAAIADGRCRFGSVEFGASLCEKVASWTRNQRAWGHYIALQIRDEIPAPIATPTLEGLSAIIALFDKAAATLKNPSITFNVEGIGTIELGRCGVRSRTPGAVNVTDGGPFGSNKWYGRINRDGTTSIAATNVLAFLADFATAPAEKAAEYGRNSGRCCFCNQKLTDERSTVAGYGPKCAENYGMPWGATAANVAAAPRA